jgi:hypothetical protein
MESPTFTSNFYWDPTLGVDETKAVSALAIVEYEPEVTLKDGGSFSAGKTLRSSSSFFLIAAAAVVLYC